MAERAFFISLFIINVVLVLPLLFFHNKGEIGDYTLVNLIAILSFSILSVLLYFLALLTLQSSNKYLFNQVVFGNMLLKMILCIAIVMVIKSRHPEATKLFAIPLIIVFVVFTIFETYVLTVLVRKSGK